MVPDILKAVENGDLEEVKRYIMQEERADYEHYKSHNEWRGYNPADLTDPDGNSILCLAVKNGHLDIVEYLMSKNVNPDVKDDGNRDVILVAVIEYIHEANTAKKSERLSIIDKMYNYRQQKPDDFE